MNTQLWSLWQGVPNASASSGPARLAPLPELSSSSSFLAAAPASAGIPASASADPPPGTFAAAFQAASAQTGVPVALLQAVAWTESANQPLALSPTGAEGVMQLEPATAAAEGVTNPWNVSQNILGGARYLAQQLQAFHGNLTDAIAAYNAGPGAVVRYGGVPPYAQTQAYVRQVTAAYAHDTANAPSKGVSL